MTTLPTSPPPGSRLSDRLSPSQSITQYYGAVSPSIAEASHRSSKDPLRSVRISPVDGRYASLMDEIAPYVCEAQLARLRVIVEAEWFRNLFLRVLPPEVSSGNEDLIVQVADLLKSFADELPVTAVTEIAEWEKKTKHDVIAMINVVRENIEKKLTGNHDRNALLQILSMVHLGLTSEDVTSTSHSMMIRIALGKAVAPACAEVVRTLREKASDFNDVEDPQNPGASLGARYCTYADRLSAVSASVVAPDYLAVKFAGATGTHAALKAIAPECDPIRIASDFVSAVAPELIYLPVTAQINPHDDLALWCLRVTELCGEIREIGREIWEDSGRDVQHGKELVKLLSIVPDAEQSGSSAMPQKVQVILIENAIGTAACTAGLARELSTLVNINRLQRELSDSRMIREILGVVIPNLLQMFRNMAMDVPKLRVNDQCRGFHSSPTQLTPSLGSKLSRNALNLELDKLTALATAFTAAGSKFAEVPFLARTHNQPASPTTLGKELRVFGQRIEYLSAILSGDLFGRPSKYVWRTEDIFVVAQGILTQFFDDLRIYTTQRLGAIEVGPCAHFDLKTPAAASRNAKIALEKPEKIGELLNSLKASEMQLTRELEAHYESLGEAVQTVLRRHGVWDAYDRVKKVTRGATMTRSHYRQMIQELLSDTGVTDKVPKTAQTWLLELQPKDFIGAAATLARLPIYRERVASATPGSHSDQLR